MSNRLLPYDTIIKTHEGDPIAIQAVLDRYAGYIRYFSKMNGYYNSDMEDYIRTKLIESLPAVVLSKAAVLSFAANIICGVAADLVAAAGKYRSKKLLLASYVVFSYGLTGPILPLWFMKSAYIANLTARGKDAAYIDTLFAPINSGSFVVSILAILICALVGGFFGQKMLKKHFEKAGIVA